MGTNDPLSIATDTYFWKPMAAFFRSRELSAYVQSGFMNDGPTLDLGCGDGGVTTMLKGLGLVTGSPHGIDIAYGELVMAKERHQHASIAQADANQLPYPDQSFSTIICNGVLCSIPNGVDLALQEIHRVLRPNGKIVVTVPTDRFLDVLLMPRLLASFSKASADRYVAKLNNRLPHFNTYSIEEWRKRFADHGLNVATTQPFIAPHEGKVWNILSMHVFRIFGALKIVGRGPLKGLFAGSMKLLLKTVPRENDPSAAKVRVCADDCRKSRLTLNGSRSLFAGQIRRGCRRWIRRRRWRRV